jgi:hypothetical protein
MVKACGGAMKYIKIVLLLLIAMASGCQRNSTFQNTVVFEGRVYSGAMNTTTNVLTVGSPVQGAVVTCENYPGSAKTASDGSYSLTISAVRGFSGINTETYTLQASYQGLDETITANGKPGDTISVRDFVVYQHTTSAPRRVYE